MSSSLENLPAEALTMICQNYCRHCVEGRGFAIGDTAEWEEKMAPNGYYFTEQTTLVSLCQTSKCLRRIAQPVLFHCFQPDSGRFRKLLFFMRTLLDRPDLAAHVHCAFFHSNLGAEIQFRSPITIKAINHLGLTMPSTVDLDEWYMHYHTLVPLTIALLPNLQELRYELVDRSDKFENIVWVFNQLADRLERGGDDGDDGDDANKEAQDATKDGKPIVRLSALVEVTIVGIWPGTPDKIFSLEDLAGLFWIVPNIRRLVGISFYGTDRKPVSTVPLVLPHVTELRLQRTYFKLPQLRRFLAALKSPLVKFSYEGDQATEMELYTEAMSKDVVDLLKNGPHRESLRVLQVRSIKQPQVRVNNSLVDFPHLEVIKVGRDVVVMQFDDTEFLVNALPPSVRHVVILDCMGGEIPMFLEVAKHHQRLPNLRRFEVDGIPPWGYARESTEKLVPAFKEAGIEYTLFDAELWVGYEFFNSLIV